ncbi:tryptophan-rich sensory protein [uncultured Deinococcus sp.]|uniref:tryptophan-rich sensory protein n=1 Tax=uncultured Deinococcus sp. TaxID=158789 RepID=UPI002582FE86|nr:tryptophan-rich sensory protein [uncultured Deinococcus sp.]
MTGAARQVTLVLVTLLTLVMNYLSNALPLFGRTNAQISDSLPNAFTPAGLTFAVWGVIFLGLLVFAVYQALPAQRSPRFDRLFWPYLLSNLLNVAWLLAFQSLSLGLSVLVMLGLLASLVTLYLRVRSLKPLGAEYAALQVPVSLYLAWICVATMANVTAFLVSQGLGSGALGLNGPLWSALLAVIAGLLGTVFLARFRDVAFALVLLWALYGVYAARPDVWAVGVGTALAAALLVLGLVGALRRKRTLGL